MVWRSREIDRRDAAPTPDVSGARPSDLPPDSRSVVIACGRRQYAPDSGHISRRDRLTRILFLAPVIQLLDQQIGALLLQLLNLIPQLTTFQAEHIFASAIGGLA